MSKPMDEDPRHKVRWAVLGGAAGSLITTAAFLIFLVGAGLVKIDLPDFGGGGSGGKPIAVQGQALFTLAGSNTIGSDLAPRLVEGFLKSQGYSDVRSGLRADSSKDTEHVVAGRAPDGAPVFVDILADGSGTAPPALAGRRADIGMMSTPMTADQASTLTSVFGGDARAPGAERTIALDGVAIIVNPGNGLQQITLGDLGKALSTARSWSEIGGRDGAIKVDRRDDASGTFDTIKSLVLQPANLKISPTAVTYESGPLVQAVASNPDSLGFVGLGFVNSSVRALSVASGPGSPAIAPSAPWIKLELYPLSRRLFLYAPTAGAKPLVQGFLQYVATAAASPIIEKSGFVPLDVELIPNAEALPLARAFAGDDDLGRTYVQRIAHADRLSLNFHFADGDALDTRGVADVQRLGAYLRGSGKSAAKLLLIGFSDPSASDPESAGRADAARIAAALAAQNAPVASDHVLSGGISRLSAGDSAGARARDRRVEVWLDN